MDFIKTYFSKNLDDLTSEDIVKFFNTPQKENQYLEFKSSREKNLDRVFTKTLKPGICSFLNSEGGILIFGAPSEDKENKEHAFHGKLEPYKKGFLGDHDTIIRKVSDGIIPMPIGIRLKEVEFPEGDVAIFEIQESNTKPHQTENIYQIRIDGQKKPAPHYLIQAMMREVKAPELIAKIKFIQLSSDAVNHVFTFKLQVFNNIESLNDTGVSLQIRGHIAGQNINLAKYDLGVISFGYPESLSHFFRITNQHFHNGYNTLELAFIFGGEKSAKKITFIKIQVPGFHLGPDIFDGWVKYEAENIKVSEFMEKFPDQKILKLMD